MELVSTWWDVQWLRVMGLKSDNNPHDVERSGAERRSTSTKDLVIIGLIIRKYHDTTLEVFSQSETFNGVSELLGLRGIRS